MEEANVFFLNKKWNLNNYGDVFCLLYLQIDLRFKTSDKLFLKQINFGICLINFIVLKSVRSYLHATVLICQVVANYYLN